MSQPNATPQDQEPDAHPPDTPGASADRPTASTVFDPAARPRPRQRPWDFLLVLGLLLVAGAVPLSGLVRDALTPLWQSDPADLDALARKRIERSVALDRLAGWAHAVLTRSPHTGPLDRELWLPEIEQFAARVYVLPGNADAHPDTAPVITAPDSSTPASDLAGSPSGLLIIVENQPLRLALFLGPFDPQTPLSAPCLAALNRQPDAITTWRPDIHALLFRETHDD